jgi:hypothetical protein
VEGTTHETYAKKLSRAIIDDWRSRPLLQKNGLPWVVTLALDIHLSPKAEADLTLYLGAAGLEFSTNQVYAGGKIQRQTNIIHIQRQA